MSSLQSSIGTLCLFLNSMEKEPLPQCSLPPPYPDSAPIFSFPIPRLLLNGIVASGKFYRANIGVI